MGDDCRSMSCKRGLIWTMHVLCKWISALPITVLWFVQDLRVVLGCRIWTDVDLVIMTTSSLSGLLVCFSQLYILTWRHSLSMFWGSADTKLFLALHYRAFKEWSVVLVILLNLWPLGEEVLFVRLLLEWATAIFLLVENRIGKSNAAWTLEMMMKSIIK